MNAGSEKPSAVVDTNLFVRGLVFKRGYALRLLEALRNKDEIVLAAALGGQADYLVTGDEDLLVLADLPGLGGLRIVRVEEFLERQGIR